MLIQEVWGSRLSVLGGQVTWHTITATLLTSVPPMRVEINVDEIIQRLNQIATTQVASLNNRFFVTSF